MNALFQVAAYAMKSALSKQQALHKGCDRLTLLEVTSSCCYLVVLRHLRKHILRWQDQPILADPYHNQNWPFAGFGSPPSDRGRNQLQNEASPQEPSRSRMQNWWGYIFLLNSESGVKYSWWWFEIESTSRQRCVSYAGEKKQILLKIIIFHSLSIAQVRVCEVVIFRPLPHTCKQVLRKYQNHYSSHLQTTI